MNNFYNERKSQLDCPQIKPNSAHISLAELENNCSKEFLIVTQNIDNLHERAGTKKILHMHGSLESAYCMYCKNKVILNFNLSTNYRCKNCLNKGMVRVDVVWFGEQPKYLEEIYNLADKVYPANAGIMFTERSDTDLNIVGDSQDQNEDGRLFHRINDTASMGNNSYFRRGLRFSENDNNYIPTSGSTASLTIEVKATDLTYKTSIDVIKGDNEFSLDYFVRQVDTQTSTI